MAAKRKGREELRKERFEVAQKFADAVVKKFGAAVKAVITWGSITRKEQTFKKASDIDCLVIVDDTSMRLTEAARAGMDAELKDLAKSIDKRISVQPTWLLTEFWDMVRQQSPLAYSVLREGWALYDTGFFIPLRKLYERGRFPATKEAAYLKFEAVPRRIRKAESAKLFIIFDDLFYAMLEAAQAVLMYMGREPPGIRGSPDAVNRYLVDAGLLEKSYADDLEAVVKFHKGVEHGKIRSVSGQDTDEWIERAKRFVARFEKLLERLEEENRAYEIRKATEVAVKATITALKTIGRLPDDPKELPDAFRRHLVEAGLVSTNYAGILERMLGLQKLVSEGKAGRITDEEVYASREYVRKFILDIRNLLRERAVLPETKVEQEKVRKVEKRIEKAKHALKEAEKTEKQ